jgi:hypothetical protein
VDHIYYGFSIEPELDYNITPLNANIGTIADSVCYGWHSLDITQYYLQDLDLQRFVSQYRLRFPIDSDWDNLTDGVKFASALYDDFEPRLYITYTSTVENNDPCNDDNTFPVCRIYPNPVKQSLVIQFFKSINSNLETSVYNIKGQEVFKSDHNLIGDTVKITLPELTKGYYLLKMRTSNQQITKRLFIHE